MNYIKRLEKEIEEANQDKKCAEDIVNELFRYLNSDKFNCGNSLDQYVNVKDIATYLHRIKAVL